ncbi:heavy-metal-associated domain-containing protein [Altererythrobacter sp. Z27]|uniref:heavy-metal-associated domain-containing protein n=1 Tax=Altererythrobacter sp. Z27 TaxID=3461147 RepID=UPI00404444AD
MTTLTVSGMNCASCVRTITNAVQGLDPAAMVAVNLADKSVQTNANVTLEALKAAVEAAGYNADPA